MWKKRTYPLSRHPGRDPWSAGNNKECGRNRLTSCQGTQAEIHGQLRTTKNVEEKDLHPVKAPRQRSMVSWEQQRKWKKRTYPLSRHPGRDPWSAGNNKECGRNRLTSCQGTQAEIHGQLRTTKNVEEKDLHPVKAPRQRSMVSWEQQRKWKKRTYPLSRHPGRDPWSAGNNKECGRNRLTSCQGTQAEIHGQLGTTKNVEEMDLHPVKAPRQRSMVSWEQQRMWKKWTYILTRHPGRDPWSAGNNKECGRNGLTSCQGTQAEIHGQLGTTKNVEEMDLQPVKAPRQRSMVSWEQQRTWKKRTYILSRHPGRDPWSAGNNKESGRNGLTACQGTQAEIHGQLGTTKNVEEMDLQAVKAPRQRSMVSWEQQRMWKKWTYILSRHPGRDPWSSGNNKECG